MTSPIATSHARSEAAAARPEGENAALAASDGVHVAGLSPPAGGRRFDGVLLLFFSVVLLKNTWLCEDAFITYRVVDNFVHGLGLRWNPLERVQVYTHPLWMLCVSAFYFVSRDIYFAAACPSILCSLVAVGLILFRGMKSLPHRLVACAILSFSKAFVDFSTGGLENPLSHLLLVLFFLELLKPDRARRFGWMAWTAGLELVNRMDSIWLVLPGLAYAAWRGGHWRLRDARLWTGLLSFVAWEVFATIYYGFPFPNPAYAKLGSGVGWLALLEQGRGYFINSLAWDPITLSAIAVLGWLGLRPMRRTPAAFALSLGVLSHLAYTLSVGGDYMTGRFFTAPLAISVLLLPSVDFSRTLELCTVVAAVLILGYASPRVPIATTDGYVGLGSAPQGVDDERGYRHNDTSLLRLARDHSLAGVGGWVGDGQKAKREHQRVSVYKNIGYYGFFAGPEVHIIDPFGLGDALMARIPFKNGFPWVSGHFFRNVPEGYLQAAIGEGVIADPLLAQYWEKLELVTRGPLFSRKRLRQILRFNLGLDRPPR